MQFNPACLSGTAQCPPPTTTTTNTNHPSEFINLPSNLAYSDASSSNAWSNSIINALPLYGIFNSSLVAVPTESSTFNIPIVSQPVNDKKKPTQKRPQGKEEEATKPDDKNQGLDDEQKMKRQRRLLKNREAAQQFRQRQKEYIQNLERKVSDLNNVVAENHKHIELINTENRLLRDQLVYLYNVMRQNLSLSPTSPPSAAAFSPLSSLPHQPITAIPAPTAPPPGALDLGLAFKGFGVFDGTVFEEMIKNSTSTPAPALISIPTHSATPLQVMIPSPVPISNPPSLNSTPVPSPMPSPCNTPRISADLTAMSLSKEADLEGLNNPLLVRSSLFSSVLKVGENEAQTVPELIVKAEGAGNM